jgi:hypothetical protein
MTVPPVPGDRSRPGRDGLASVLPSAVTWTGGGGHGWLLEPKDGETPFVPRACGRPCFLCSLARVRPGAVKNKANAVAPTTAITEA